MNTKLALLLTAALSSIVATTAVAGQAPSCVGDSSQIAVINQAGQKLDMENHGVVPKGSGGCYSVNTGTMLIYPIKGGIDSCIVNTSAVSGGSQCDIIVINHGSDGKSLQGTLKSNSEICCTSTNNYEHRQ